LKALVTGAGGFIGSYLVEALLQEGWEVRCLLRRPLSEYTWLNGLDIEAVAGDVTCPETLSPAVKEVDTVFHLAGVTAARSEDGYVRVNAEGTRHLLQAVVQHNPELDRFLFVSSLAAAGPSRDGKRLTEEMPAQPISFYGKSKLKGEEIVWQYAAKVPVSIVRPPAVFGPREKDIFTYFQLARKGWRPVISGGPRYLSMIYVHDLVAGMMRIAQCEKALNRLYYLGNERDYSWEELGENIAAALGRKTRKLTVPISLVHVAAACSDVFAKLTRKATIFNLDKYKEMKATHWICDASLAAADAGFRPQWSLPDALVETARWYREQGWL